MTTYNPLKKYTSLTEDELNALTDEQVKAYWNDIIALMGRLFPLLPPGLQHELIDTLEQFANTAFALSVERPNYKEVVEVFRQFARIE